jgi:mono/diheme cytochrome c family protein
MHRRHAIFSLTTILLLAVSLLAACGGSSTTIADPTLLAAGSQDAAQLYERACAACHGSLGEGGSSGVSLQETTAAERQMIIDAIRHGVGAMPASSGGMSDEQIQALADYVAGLR